jgi:hypothetical protein
MLFKKRNVIDIFGLLKLFGFLLVRPIALPKPAHALEPPAISMPLKTHNIVVVGASYAGSSVAHIFLKHVYPELPKTGAKYHVYLINPSTTFYHRSASPRAAASLDLTKNIKMFSDLPSGFKQYGSDIFTFMRGAATAMDTQKRTIKINRAEGGETVIQYHALVLATGISTYAPILSTYQTSLEELQKTILDMNSKVKAAKSIIISGGGPSAVELAGEIGEYLNGAAGWFADRPSNPQAKITLIAGADKLLPILSQRFSDWAENLLKRARKRMLLEKHSSTWTTTLQWSAISSFPPWASSQTPALSRRSCSMRKATSRPTEARCELTKPVHESTVWAMSEATLVVDSSI